MSAHLLYQMHVDVKVSGNDFKGNVTTEDILSPEHNEFLQSSNYTYI